MSANRSDVIGQRKQATTANIKRFRKLLESETDHSKRQTLLGLLQDEEAALAAFEDPELGTPKVGAK